MEKTFEARSASLLPEREKLEFEKSLEQRRFEISNFWSRGWFFGALIVFIATGFFKLLTDNPEYCIYLAFLGFWVSLFQALMNRGSKYWQERWENKTKNAEAALGIDVTLTKKFNGTERYYLDAGILAKNENWFVQARRFSVSKLTILTWDIVTISWAFAWIKSCHFHSDGWDSVRWDALGYHVIITVYILIFFFYKSGRRQDKAIKNGGRALGYTGGKVYEGFAKDKKFKHGPFNVREPYYSDSEAYYKDWVEDLHDKEDTTA
ncbi:MULTISPECIES: RipA family octameric membrane protein [Niastella]|uniref:Uncharacterized protein n=1 Tax=Niastella soli TaxID=2821487 RepID=A0ABS3YQ10_9BACT|nr:hypothetical protein [Niastella soli]MBO9199540.1 hypothetical protein [Niastella soli]